MRPIIPEKKERIKEEEGTVTIEITGVLDTIVRAAESNEFTRSIGSKLLSLIKSIRPIELSTPRNSPSSSSKVFLRNSQDWGLKINDTECFEDGVVSEEEYTDVLRSLSNILKSWKKEGYIEGYKAREELFDGPFTKNAPEFIFELGNYSLANHPTKAFIPKKNHNHGPRAYLAVDTKNLESKRPKMQDIAPTILNLAGLKIPISMTGKLLVNSGKEPVYREPEVPNFSSETSEEYGDVEERLKGLGYL